MSWFSGIKTGFKAIFGGGSDGSSNVMNVAKGIGGFIDEQKFTEQEKAEYVAKIIPAFQLYMDSTVSENTQRSITRREIAIWIIRNWILMLWVGIVAYGLELSINATNHEFSSFILGIVTLSTVEYLVLGVGAFFFGAHIIRTGFEGIKQKETK